MPRQQNSDGPSGWTLGIIIVLILIIVVLLYSQIAGLLVGIINPQVNVSGNVRVIGFTAVPSHVTFTSQGTPSTVAVSNGDSYDILLQNSQIYNISVQWVAAGGLASGNCTGGSLNLHTGAKQLTYNISC